MAFYDNTEKLDVITEETRLGGSVGITDWLDVGAGAAFALKLTVTNLRGTSPTLDWSIDNTANPADAAEAVTELFASTDFTQVTGAPFPNTQMAYFGITDRSSISKVSKRYIRPKWTVGGTDSPLATVKIVVEKL